MKYYGKIGFWEGYKQTKLGIFAPSILEREYYGDILENRRRFQPVSDRQNDDLTLSSRISIVSDLYMQQHWPSIRYIVWNDVRWKVTDVDVSYPRLTLTLGGVYNEKDSGDVPPMSM